MSVVNSTPNPSAAQPGYRISDVPGFPGYRVDTIGQVWSNRHNCSRLTSYDPAKPYRPLKAHGPPGGHRKVRLQCDGRSRKFWVHRLVLQTFVGPSPPGKECRHLDGDPTNNRLENLTWGTRVENQHDRRKHGTDNAGARHYGALLTEAQVREIRQRYSAGDVTQAALGHKYGVSARAVSKIILGATYTAAGGPISPAGKPRADRSVD